MAGIGPGAALEFTPPAEPGGPWCMAFPFVGGPDEAPFGLSGPVGGLCKPAESSGRGMVEGSNFGLGEFVMPGVGGCCCCCCCG